MSAHKLKVQHIERPNDLYMVEVETDLGRYSSSKQMFFEQKEFLDFFKPIIDLYMILDTKEFENGRNSSSTTIV